MVLSYLVLAPLAALVLLNLPVKALRRKPRLRAGPAPDGGAGGGAGVPARPAARGRVGQLLGLNLAADELSFVLLLSVGIVIFVTALVGRAMMADEKQRFYFMNVLLVSLIGMNGAVLVTRPVQPVRLPRNHGGGLVPADRVQPRPARARRRVQVHRHVRRGDGADADGDRAVRPGDARHLVRRDPQGPERAGREPAGADRPGRVHLRPVHQGRAGAVPRLGARRVLGGARAGLRAAGRGGHEDLGHLRPDPAGADRRVFLGAAGRAGREALVGLGPLRRERLVQRGDAAGRHGLDRRRRVRGDRRRPT